MLKKVMLLSAIVVLAVVAPCTVQAQSATSATWSTSITYYTPSDTEGTLTISYYAEGSSTAINADPITLAPHKAGSLYIGNVSGIGSTFSGAAVLSADVPIVATAVNLAGSEYPRSLYSGFSASQASNNFFIPTVLYQKWNTTSLVSIQNVESSSVQATLRVYAEGATTPSFEQTYTIEGQSAKLIPAGNMGLSPGFTGSATVEATGNVVAAVQETSDNGRDAKAFEGVASDAGATTIYMASMACRAYGSQEASSYYAIQNVGTGQATVEIDFYDTSGNKLYTATGITINEGSKSSQSPCDYTSQASTLEGAAGSAVIRSTNGVPLIAIGKMNSANMTATAFLGESAGSTNVAAPYIRWKADPTAGERANVAVMNVGTSNATNIVAKYYDNQGNLAATHILATAGDPLPPYIKVNTNPSVAGALDANGDFGVNPYGGAVEIESDQPVVVVVRIAKNVAVSPGKFTEDYNGISIAP